MKAAGIFRAEPSIGDRYDVYNRALIIKYFWRCKIRFTRSHENANVHNTLATLVQFNNIQVSRRYKHFDWLHERLEEKFCFIPIPPLPDKQISGRYEEQFIEHRRTQLQEFVDYVCRHPVLSRSRVWQHFITCTDEKRWKAGKRHAEKEELLGVNCFHGVQCPDTILDAIKVEFQIDGFAR
jgi:sorting nexin-9/18/33